MKYYKWTRTALRIVKKMRADGFKYEEIIKVLPKQEGVTLTAHAVRNTVCRLNEVKKCTKRK